MERMKLRFALVLVVFAACNRRTPTCVQGSSIACACPTGGSGAQICNATGTYDTCECTKVQPPSATDVAAAVPVGPPVAQHDDPPPPPKPLPASATRTAPPPDDPPLKPLPTSAAAARDTTTPPAPPAKVRFVGHDCEVQRAVIGLDKVIVHCRIYNSDDKQHLVHASASMDQPRIKTRAKQNDFKLPAGGGEDLRFEFDDVDIGREGQPSCHCLARDWDGTNIDDSW
jgi:hypothetical protein